MPNIGFNARIKHRRDSETNWSTNNPALLNGECVIVDMDDGSVRIKIGDGVNNFTSLPYVDDDLRDAISSLSYKIQPITQTEYDALTTKDTNTLYVIEV